MVKFNTVAPVPGHVEKSDRPVGNFAILVGYKDFREVKRA